MLNWKIDKVKICGISFCVQNVCKIVSLVADLPIILSFNVLINSILEP